MRTRRRPFHLISAVAVALASITAGAAAPATAEQSTWLPQPEPASYGRSQPVQASVTMDDGVVLSARVVYPADPGTTARAPGKFPVLITQNPYGTGRGDPGGYFVERGYIYVAVAVRGTGTSGGQLDWFGQRQGRDGAALVNWAARTLSGSDGNVGLDGCSYLGVNQWFTAAAVGPRSALKAIAPFCTDSDFYEDLTASGGIPTTFVQGIGRAIPRGPQDDPLTDPLSVTVNDLRSGGPRSYDNEYWRALDVQQLMPKIVANGIPALSQSGWNDLFPGGNLCAYVAAQNAYFHRPLVAPVLAGQPVTGRYQAIVGPWTHGQHVDEEVLANIRKEWFDTWLKHKPTRMADTRKPLHLFQNGANRWVDTAAWPPSPGTETYYLGNAGSLSTKAPAAPGSDALAWSTGSLTYTTSPLPRATVLDGPIGVSVYLNSSTRDAQVTATVNLVAPDGPVTKQGEGVLLASMRTLDTRQSWYGDNKALIKPSHPFTQASQQLLTPGRTERMDIAVLPNFTLIPAGHRLQVVLTGQAPAGFHLQLAPTPQQQANLALGQYSISRAPHAASSITLPLASPHLFTTSPVVWGPSS